MGYKILYGENERVGPWVYSHTGGEFPISNTTTLGLEKDGELVCGVVYEANNGASVRAHIANTGYIPRGFLYAIFAYPFIQCGLHVIIGLVDSNNVRALKFDLKLGFRLSTVVPNAVVGGDLAVLTMNRKYCRFLSEKYRQAFVALGGQDANV